MTYLVDSNISPEVFAEPDILIPVPPFAIALQLTVKDLFAFLLE
jgi:hypothetical protein